MSKRKAEEAAAGAVPPANEDSVARKEKKRKLKETQDVQVEQQDGERKLSKEERKEKKRLKKEKKERKAKEQELQGEQSVATAHAQSEEDVPQDEKAAKRAAKEARKAEKKRLKALNGAGSSESQDATAGSIVTANGSNGYEEASSLRSTAQSEVDKFLKDNHITISDAGTDSKLRPILAFSHLPATATPEPKIFASFSKPTPIQSAAWPFLLSGRDVIGVAETGSGKTLAFGVPCVRHIASSRKGAKLKGSPARAVIVSPTRELAVQIYEQIVLISKSAGLEAVCVYGGVPKDGQRHALKTAHIVVATPGRLNDLIEEGYADLSNVSYVVLDEADRMLDKGFEQEIRKIISSTLPSPSSATVSKDATRQTLMFTATWPPSVRELAATFMYNPVRINIGADNPTGELRANTRIKQLVEVIDPRGKEQRLLQLIKQHQSGKNSNDRILVFCLYKKEAMRVEGFLQSRGMRVAGIHGDLSQERRSKSLESFKSGETPLLVATDVAARGLDIPSVKLVLNVTFPLTAEDYVHRIGRTGRAGADGLAITLFTEHDKAQSGALINVLKAANQPVPEDLMKFGTTVKKKQHETYGAFYKEGTGKKAEKIKFDD